MGKFLVVLGLLLQPYCFYADSHSLWMLATLIKGDTPFPELTVIAMLDDIPFGYYDSNDKKLVYRDISLNNSDTTVDRADLKYYIFVRHLFDRMKGRAEYLEISLNHTNDIYVYQRASGCDLPDSDKPGGMMSMDAFNGEAGDTRYYNPELHTVHTNRIWPEGVDTIWSDNFDLLYNHVFYPTCIDKLKSHLGKWKNRVLKKVNPRIRLLQRTLSDSGGIKVTCLATGFYPRHINLTLLRDGQPVSDHQITGGELLPNGDETYQMRKSLEDRAEELQNHHYTCTAEHLTLDNKLVVDLEFEWDSSTSVITSTVYTLVPLLVLGVVGIYVCWRRHAGMSSLTSHQRNYPAGPDTEENEMISLQNHQLGNETNR